MAEKEGFEPSIGINLYTLSRRAPSAARTLLQNNAQGILKISCIQLQIEFGAASKADWLTNHAAI